MKEQDFINSKSNTWQQLEALSEKINKKGIKALNSKEIKHFLQTFRQCSHHLAYARVHYPNSSTVNYLNALVGKVHSHVYAVNKISSGGLKSYITYGFPLQLKTFRWYILSSFGAFAFGTLLSLILVLVNSNYAGLFLPPHLVEGIKSGEMGGGQWNYPLMSSYIMFNNISVSLRAFVLGITLGLGTIYVLFFNGALLGALTALVYLYGDPVHYWSLILPHGIIELVAIFISGAAGLMIAKAILIPGEYSRKNALIKAAKEAVALMMGVVLMLVIAGLIEGFFTPLDISPEIKLIFATSTAFLLGGYLSIPYFKQNKKQH